MSLSQDLLEQARLLATKEPRRPKDASLRRAFRLLTMPFFTF